MFERFIQRYHGNPAVSECLDAYVEGAYSTAIESAFEALRHPSGAGFELLLIAMLCMDREGGTMEWQARELGREVLSSARYPIWDKELVRIVLGLTGIESVLDNLPQGAQHPITSTLGLVGEGECRRCQAYYYHGARIMLMDHPACRAPLREAILTGAVSMLEFELAIAQLEQNLEERLDRAYLYLGRGYLDLLLKKDLGQAREAEKVFSELGATRELRIVQGLIARQR